MKTGQTGWLSPEGVFHSCQYGEHYQLAQDIFDEHEERERLYQERQEVFKNKDGYVGERDSLAYMKWIPMGVPDWGSQPQKDYLFIKFDVGITKAQFDWFKSNKDKLSETQLNMLNEFLSDEEMEMI